MAVPENHEEDVKIVHIKADNGRMADYFSVTGRHTVNNSDRLYVNPDLGLVNGQNAAILQLVADGVTGGGSEGIDHEELLETGAFVAQRIVDLLPEIFKGTDPNLTCSERFVDAMKKATDRIGSDFFDKFEDEFEKLDDRNVLGGWSTLTGVIETTEAYAMFSFGDSKTVFLPSGTQKLGETVTKSTGDSRIGVYMLKEDAETISVCDDTMSLGSTLVVPKAVVPPGSRFFSLSDGLYLDGLYTSSDFVTFLKDYRTVSSYQLLLDIYHRAEKVDSFFKARDKFHGTDEFREDDKTVVITSL